MSAPRQRSAPFAEKTVLPNGVRVVTERLDHVDSISLGIWSATGSRSDPPGMEGVAHFLEHMLFKGTATRSALQIAEAVDDIGGQVNGVTDREELHLYARTVADHAGIALEMLFDILLNSRCDDGDVEREREVVLQEIAQVRDSAEDWMHELMPQLVWPGHPIGRSLMGASETVAAIDGPALRRFLASEVQAADRLLVAAAGRLDHERLAASIAALTADLRPAGPACDDHPPGFSAGERLVSEEGAQVHLCRVSPGIPRADSRRDAFAVLDTLLGGGSSSRLFQEIRENRGLAYEIGTYLVSYRQCGVCVVTAGTAPENFRLVLDLIEREIARLRERGPSEEEVARAKVQIRTLIALAAESTGFRMHHLANSELYWGRVLSFDEIIAGVNAVTAEDVHALAREMFPEDQRALIAIGPFDGNRRAT